MLQIFNCTTFTCLAIAVYVSFTGYKLYQMVNPLSGIVVSGPTINPQWERNQTFSLLCFLSASKRFSQFKISDLKEKKVLLFVRHGLSFHESQKEITLYFNITDGRRHKDRELDEFKGNKVATSSGKKEDEMEIISATASSKIWRLLRTNTTAVYLHVLVVKTDSKAGSLNEDYSLGSSETDRADKRADREGNREGKKEGKKRKRGGSDLESLIRESSGQECASSGFLDTESLPYDEITPSLILSGSALYDIIDMVKYDQIPKHFRQRYLLSDFGLVNNSREEAERARMSPNAIISFWKPEVSVRLVTDFTHFPVNYMPEAISQNTVIPPGRRRQQEQLLYKPPIHADEIGLTSDKYIALNDTVSWLPLQISYAPLSLQRWMLMANMEESLQQQSGVGFSQKDIDDVRRLISDTSIYLLAATLIASVLHLLFEFLAFQSDISFWRHNKSLAGLSTRSVVSELFSQIVVFLFLVDSETSLLVTVPAFFGILIQAWKVHKATGVCLVWNQGSIVPFKVAYKVAAADDDEDEIEETVPINNIGNSDSKEVLPDGKKIEKSDRKVKVALSAKVLTQVTVEADRVATYHLGAMLFPLALGFALRSLISERHATWYSWGIGALTGSVYTFGFVLMCPQLFINHKLKSVSHLPWKFLIFRFLNTFIDDLFAFVIKMPTMHRLSVFRDDIVFLIYMYQRWIYRVDDSRPVEK